MGNMMKFDYYYGIEAEQFSFYRVPRLLIKDERFKELSSDASPSAHGIEKMLITVEKEILFIRI